jgi:transposase
MSLDRDLHAKLLKASETVPYRRIASLCGVIHQEYLPSYTPDLNPIEYIGGTSCRTSAQRTTGN